jgi:hypothetical protein
MKAKIFDSRFGPPTTLQVGVFAMSLFQLAWATAGMIANPDFATGANASSVQVLAVDFNGWHALSGFVAFGPGILAARRPDWSRWFSWAIIPAVTLPAVLAFFDSSLGGLVRFDHITPDFILHTLTAAYFALLLAIDHRAGAARLRPAESP